MYFLLVFPESCSRSSHLLLYHCCWPWTTPFLIGKPLVPVYTDCVNTLVQVERIPKQTLIFWESTSIKEKQQRLKQFEDKPDPKHSTRRCWYCTFVSYFKNKTLFTSNFLYHYICYLLNCTWQNHSTYTEAIALFTETQT